MINILYVRLFVLLFVTLMTSSCVKYHEILKSEFPQGQDEPDQRKLAHAYVRSSTVYDQFSTLGVFDVIWLSDEVNEFYAQTHGKRRGKDDDACKALLAQQNKDREEVIAFYVLADLRTKTNKYLHEKGSYWTLALEMADGKCIEASSIKNIELEPEYQKLLGNRFNLFKEVYLVTFPKHVFGFNYLEKDEPLVLLISSPYKNFKLSWNRDKSLKTNQKKLLKHENCDWF